MLPDVEKGLAKSDSFDTTHVKGVVQLKTYVCALFSSIEIGHISDSIFCLS
jgi:hypothetical protein